MTPPTPRGAGERLLSIPHAAELLNIRPSKARYWVARGLIRTVQTERGRRVPLRVVRDLRAQIAAYQLGATLDDHTEHDPESELPTWPSRPPCSCSPVASTPPAARTTR